MAKKVTDPSLINELNKEVKVTDPALIAELEGLKKKEPTTTDSKEPSQPSSPSGDALSGIKQDIQVGFQKPKSIIPPQGKLRLPSEEEVDAAYNQMSWEDKQKFDKQGAEIVKKSFGYQPEKTEAVKAGQKPKTDFQAEEKKKIKEAEIAAMRPLAKKMEAYDTNFDANKFRGVSNDFFKASTDFFKTGEGGEDLKAKEAVFNEQIEGLDKDYINALYIDRPNLYLDEIAKYMEISEKNKKGEASDNEREYLYEVRSNAIGAKMAAEKVKATDLEKSVDLKTYNREMTILNERSKMGMSREDYMARQKDIERRTGVTPEVISKLDNAYDNLSSLYLASRSVDAQFNKAASESLNAKWADEEKSRNPVVEFVRSFAESATQSALSLLQLPKTLGLDKPADYDPVDILYDFAGNVKKDVAREYGSTADFADRPTYAKIPSILGQGLASVAMFAVGGSAGGASKAATFAATAGTSYLITQADLYKEAIEAGMDTDDAETTSSAIAVVVSSLEGIIPDSKYLEQELKSSVIRAYRSGKTAKESLKLALKELPESATQYLATGGKEGLEEWSQTFGEGVSKSVANELAGQEFYKNNFDLKEQGEAMLGGLVVGPFMRFFGSRAPKSTETKSAMRGIAENADSIIETMQTAAPEQLERSRETIENAKNTLAALSKHSGWNTLSEDKKDEAFVLADEISALKQESKETGGLGLTDTAKEEEIAEKQEQLNTILNDRKDEKRIPSEVGVGQEPIQTEPEQGTSEEATSADRILQTQEVEDTRTDEENIAAETEYDEVFSKVKEVAPDMSEDDIDHATSLVQEYGVTPQEAVDHVKINNILKTKNNGKLLNRLSQEEEQGRIIGGAANVESTIIAEGVHRTGEKNKWKEFKIKNEEEEAIKSNAKKEGYWITDVFSEPDTSGAESDVYYTDNGKSVIKIVKNELHHSSWLEFFDRVSIYNSLFPETAYKVIGFTNHKGKFSAVLKQPLVKAERSATKQEISKDMAERGFDSLGMGRFHNKKTGVFIGDLHGDNVVVSREGNLLYIDPVIKVDYTEPSVKTTRTVAISELQFMSKKEEKIDTTAEQVDQIDTTKIEESTSLFKELDEINRGRSIRTRTENKKAFENKYGEKAIKAKEITTNFAKYEKMLMDSGIITKKECK